MTPPHGSSGPDDRADGGPPPRPDPAHRAARWGGWRRLRAGVLALGGLGLAAAAFAAATEWMSAGGGGEVRASLSLVETLGGGDTAGFARAASVRAFDFPADHGPHPRFRTEWWYVTGNLRGPEGRRFGYQLTFFRSALAPPRGAAAAAAASGSTLPDLTSAWSADQAWMAHFAVTDPAAGRFHAFERFDRQALGLAGARADPLRVWVGDWEMRGDPGAAFPLRLRAERHGVEVDLTLEPAKGPVLQGEDGLSRKGPEPGNASYYYSFTRLETEGRITTPSDTVEVRGTSWLDREWSTSVLPEDVVGWDWFGLQLEGARELMVYRLRREDGSAHPRSEGVWVEPDGTAVRLPAGGYEVEELEQWRSPRSGVRYPSAWRITVPAERLDLVVTPILADQELDLAFRYWEGAVDVEGWRAGEELRGVGYVELTGYEAGRGGRARGEPGR